VANRNIRVIILARSATSKPHQMRILALSLAANYLV